MTSLQNMGLIVAVDASSGIAKDGTIPWALRKDMARFYKTTTAVSDPDKRNVVLMGRKCWESIPAKFRPLKNRLNVVVSRTMQESTSNDVLVRNDLEKAVEELSEMVERGEIERIWNLGGCEIYSWGLRNDLVDTIEITKISSDIGTMSAETARLIKHSLEFAKVGTDEEKLQNGKDFYMFFFTNYPDLRVYFKGAETFTAEDVQKSERFEKQGQRILLAVHVLAETYNNQEVFKAYVRETINRHRVYKMDPALWLPFFTVFTGYLGTKTTLDDATKAAWEELGKAFNEEAQAHLKNSDLPHV